MVRGRLVMAAIVMMVSAAPAAGQISVSPTPLTVPGGEGEERQERLTIRVASNWSGLADLTRYYNSGDWGSLQARAAQVLHELSCRGDFAFALPTGAACAQGSARRGFDLRSDYVALVWVGRNGAGKRAVRRVLVHEPAPEQFTARIPGLPDGPSRVYEVFLSEQTAAGHAAAYVFTKVDDPVAAQLPAFVGALQAPLFQLASSLLGTVRAQEQAAQAALQAMTPAERSEAMRRASETKPLSIWVRHMLPPIRRASVAIKDVVAVPVTGSALQRSVEAVTTELRVVDAGTFVCARTYAESVGAALANAASAAVCRDDATEAACFAGLETAINGVTTECAGDEGNKAIRKVSEGFRKWLIGIGGSELSLDSAMQNEPRRHFSFGALTSIAVYAKLSDERVKLNDDGVIVADPLNRQLTMAVVNFSPAGYDASSSRLTAAERVQPFVGAVILPDFGFAGGVTVSIWRGIGANVGVALLAIPTIERGEEVGLTPQNPKDPLGLGWGRAVFVGLSYNFGSK